jgi:hypothetical protein
VSNGSTGQDEIAGFLEEIQDCKPASGVHWLTEDRLRFPAPAGSGD